jgi:hypothetical protein
MDPKACSGRFLGAAVLCVLGMFASAASAQEPASAPEAWLEERLARLERAPYPDIRKTPASPRDFTPLEVWMSRRDGLEAERARLFGQIESAPPAAGGSELWAATQRARLDDDSRASPAPAWTQDPEGWAQRARAAVAPPPLP